MPNLVTLMVVYSHTVYYQIKATGKGLLITHKLSKLKRERERERETGPQDVDVWTTMCAHLTCERTQT